MSNIDWKDVTKPVKVLVCCKDSHWYIYTYTDDNVDLMLWQLSRHAADPLLNLGLDDAAQLASYVNADAGGSKEMGGN